MINICNICKKNIVVDFKLKNIPPQQNNYLKTRTDAEKFQKASITYLYCERCNHVSITKDKSIEFGTEYNNEIENSHVSLSHLKDVRDFITDYLNDNESFIVEVGCGRGQLLNLLHESHFKNIFGYDPCSEKENVNKFVKNEYWGAGNCPHSIDLLVLRHTLEELPKITSFFDFIEVKNIQNIYIEITNLSNIIKNFDIYSLYPECKNIFSIESTLQLFAKYGYRLNCVKNYFNSSWSGIILEKMTSIPKRKFSSTNNFVKNYITNLKGTCVLWGAGGRGSDLLSFCKLDTSTISYVVDLNNSKVGKFIPPFGQEIINVERLNKLKPSNVIISSSKFLKENKNLIKFETNIVSIQDIINLSFNS